MSWKTVELGDICEFTRGLTYSKTDEVEFSNNAVLRATNIDLESNKLNLEEIRYINSSVKIKEDKKVKLNDILICTASGSKSHLGKVALINEQLDMAFGGFMAVLRVKKNIEAKFLFNYLTSNIFLNYISRLADGANINNLKFSQIKNLKINLPSIATQQKIVAKLDAIFAEIDVAITAAEANAKNAEALFQSYLTEVFERGSEGWKEIKIKELGKVVTGNTPKTNEPENYGDFISFVKPGDFKGDGSIDLEKQKLSLIGMNKSRVIDEKSALMVCIGATIGKCGYTETKITTNQQVNSITPTEQFNHIFIYLQMLTNDFQNRVNIRSGQATLPIINKSKWESLTLKFPALNDQIKIVNRFNTLRIETDNFRNSKLSKLNELNILKQSILQKAFSGELVKD